MKFKYIIELKEGYYPTMEEECECEVQFAIQAKNNLLRGQSGLWSKSRDFSRKMSEFIP